MSGCFVRALWGDHKLANFDQVLDEVRWCVSQPHQPEPTMWFAYGDGAMECLRAAGIKSPIPFTSPTYEAWSSARDDDCDEDRIVRGGVTMWQFKYLPIRSALEQFPACVWLDLDTVLTCPLPNDFWQRMARGQPFQATIQQNMRRRAGWRGDANEPRKTPAGACLYFRGSDVIARMMQLYYEHPREWDLSVLARLTDELMGGYFKGSLAYKQLGYEPYCHTLGHRAGRQVHNAEIPLFKTEWRKVGLIKCRAKQENSM